MTRFNSPKSQTTVFGGRSPSHFVVQLNEAPVPYVDTVKYLGVVINSRTNCVDPSAALRKFLGCFNIMSVLGYGRKNFNACWRESAKPLIFLVWYYFCFITRRPKKNIFYIIILYAALRVICRLHLDEAQRLSSLCPVFPGYTSNVDIN